LENEVKQFPNALMCFDILTLSKRNESCAMSESKSNAGYPNTQNIHVLPECFFTNSVSVHVIGCGGTGSQLIPRLAQLSKCMIALGHPGGLNVTIWDDDTVSEHNCLRQNFFQPDVGHNKAIVMANRCNIAHGTNWKAIPKRFTSQSKYLRPDIIIGCVDSKEGRREIDTFIRETYHNCIYWIDAGNDANSAQIIVGNYGRDVMTNPMRLPLVTELYPEILEGEDDNTPSCSARESILKQGLATNAMAATWIYSWLAEAFRFGQIEWSGLFFNLSAGRASSIPVSKKAWDAIRPAVPVEIMLLAA
jgi:PRTRC genetic system ThiF family protein